MEVYKIDWVDKKGNEYRGSAWSHQLVGIVKELLHNEDVVVFTILNSVDEVMFEVMDDGEVIDKLNILNKSEE